MTHFITAQAKKDDEAITAALTALGKEIEIACNCLNTQGRGAVADSLRRKFQPFHNALEAGGVSPQTNTQSQSPAAGRFLLPKAD